MGLSCGGSARPRVCCHGWRSPHRASLEPSRSERETVGATPFEDVFAAEFGPLFRYLRRRVGEAGAEDLAEATFATAFANWERLDPDRPLRPWLYGIAANLLRHHWRDERRMLRAYARSGVDPVLADDDEAAARVDAGAQRRALAAALAELRPGEREILLPHAWAELSDSEIADSLASAGDGEVAAASHPRAASEPLRPGRAKSSEGIEHDGEGTAMIDSDLQLLIDFRSEVAEPDEETSRRIYALATAPTAPARSRVRRSGRPPATGFSVRRWPLRQC